MFPQDGSGSSNSGGMFGSGSSLGGDLGSLFENWMGSQQQNPYDAGSQYYNQIPGMLGGTYQPWMQQGQQAGQFLTPQYQQMAGMGAPLEAQYAQMAQNPGQFMNKVGQGFQQSPGFNFAMKQALEQMNSAGAAGGYAGTPAEQQQMGQVATGMADQDYYNWLHNAMGTMNTGLQGAQAEQFGGLSGLGNEMQIGANAANQYGNQMGQAMTNQGINATNQGIYGNAQQNSLWGSVGNLISDFL